MPDYREFAPSPALASKVLVRKTIAANAVIATAEKALETAGGSGLYRKLGLERLLRQVMAAKPDYHHAYNALGYSLAERNIRLPEARQLIQTAKPIYWITSGMHSGETGGPEMLQELTYRLAAGKLDQRMLFRADEAKLRVGC